VIRAFAINAINNIAKPVITLERPVALKRLEICIREA
jgi:hypothetical protein